MIKFVAMIRPNGKGKVLNVAEAETRRVVAREMASGSVILGEYCDPRHAEKAITLGLRGWRQVEERRA